MKVCLFFMGFALAVVISSAQSSSTEPPTQPRSERLILEEKHFIECLAYVYSPALWINYKGSLYFAPKDENQFRQIEALKAARSKYIALTNREARHELASTALASSGLDEHWQKKLLLPYSDSNPNLTPTLNRPFRVLKAYKVLQSLEEGDVLIQDGQEILLLMGSGGHGVTETNTALPLVKEGERSFAASSNEFQRVEAFSRADLGKEEVAVLNRAVAAFQAKDLALAQELANFKAKQEFEDSKARATDNNPYLQYVVARSYLEGKGVQKDDRLGLEWMTRAANNGSGDAKTYLEKVGQKPSQ
jgi:TPR repeat protein